MDASRLIISDEERRRVAALLRKEADGWAEDCPDTVTCESYDCYEFILNIADSADIDLSKPPSMLFDRLADLIDRPTTKRGDWGGTHWRCEQCGAFNRKDAVTDLLSVIPLRHCANCGAEVVSDDD